ncbi:hypothetical protein AVEN_241218-1 [Araneus ventricosus]|uniref:Uncharacterized protein n=1 Tax=Araneus ventricosus TaxID=182803 RepID=A0A4Y2D1N4_ARAVE|nr:hypothetical protein AVEN_241218-1 [Araneus ventricosus]
MPTARGIPRWSLSQVLTIPDDALMGSYENKCAVLKFGLGMPTRLSSTSSDRGSKLRDPFRNSPHVASKLDVNVTKLKTKLN